MSILEMSFAGGVLILAVIVLRAMTLNRLPKWTFLSLWAVAALRLLLPFSIPSPASVYTLVESVQTTAEVSPEQSLTAGPAAIPALADFTPGIPSAVPAADIATKSGTAPADVWPLVWLAGAAVCGMFFLLSYLRCRREFQTALPVTDERLQTWLADRRLRRRVSLRQSDRVDAPLTYGLLRPVILLPKNWRNEAQLAYVLEHELAHIRHLDALWKLVLAFTACVHWFNPLVWCMLVLANRDIELRCDEVVVRRMGLDRRKGYALALIGLEAKKSGLGPFASAFSKNAIEERIRAVMKIKKRSLAAVLAAVVLVCCVGVAFATSAAEKTPYPNVEEGSFTKKELDRLASLWFKGYEEMTVAEYQQKMWLDRDNPEDLALIERYGQNEVYGGFYNDEEATRELNAFQDYFHDVYEPLTAEHWQNRMFFGVEAARDDADGLVLIEYAYTLRILDADRLTAGEYQRMHASVEVGIQAMLGSDPSDEDFAALSQQLSDDTLEVTVEGLQAVWDRYAKAADGSFEIEIDGQTKTVYQMLTSPDKDLYAQSSKETQELYDYLYGMGLNPEMTADGFIIVGLDDPDAMLHAQSSKESSDEWDRVLSPYAPFGLTWKFYDPDLDGNGLTMWWGGKEVRGIYDQQEGMWITEHTGTGFSEGAVELYAVYTNGVLSGLREATPEEQAAFDADRQHNATIYLGTAEVREFPRATLEDYNSLLTLRPVEDTDLPEWASYTYRDARDLPLEVFNQRLLDWANENPDTWDRIMCDVLWNDFDKELTSDAKTFAAVTCNLSGTENGQMVRALHTGEPEEDPHFSRQMPMKSDEENGIVNAWCDLYYDISYHVSDKSTVTAWERDACVGGMMNAISVFWQDKDLDTLLKMTETDVVAEFNRLAEEASTEGVKINPITTDDIHFEPYDERGIRD